MERETQRAKLRGIASTYGWRDGGGRTLGMAMMLRKGTDRYVWLEFTHDGFVTRAVVSGRVWVGLDVYDRVLKELTR